MISMLHSCTRAMDTMNAVPLLLLATTATLLLQSVNGQGCQRRVCYYNDKAQHRTIPAAKFFPEDIDPTLCTHVIYYTSRLWGNDVVSSESHDKFDKSAGENYEKVTNLKQKERNLKVLLSLEGGRCERYPFVFMSSSQASRGEFIANIINYLRRYQFDGLDLRCVFLKKDIIPPKVKNSLSDLVQELRQAIDQEATGSNRLLLTLVVYGERAIDESCYDVASLSKNVDWINLWAIDLHGDWYPTTGHPSPLFQESKSPAEHFSVDTAVQYWINEGAPREKIVIALPSFGRSYTLTSAQINDGAPATGGGRGPYSRLPGRLAYYEICELMQAEGTAFRILENQRVPFLVSGEKWVGYETPDSLTKKVTFLKNRSLGGFAFIWIDTDDFSGVFCKQGPYPLLKAIINACDI